MMDVINSSVKVKPENYIFLVHYLLLAPTKDKRHLDFIPINKPKLQKLFSCKPDSYIKFLEKYELIESDKQVIPGKKAAYYRLNPSIEYDTNTYELQPGTLLFKNLIKHVNTKRTNHSRLEPFLNEMKNHFMGIDFDFEGAYNWIKTIPDARKRLSYTIAVSQIEDKRFRYFKRNKTNNRLDTNLTNLKKELRNFIIGDYVSIDLTNSQPFFLSQMLLKISELIKYFHQTNQEITHNNLNQYITLRVVPLCSDLVFENVVETFGLQCFKSMLLIRKKQEFGFFTNLWDFKKAVEAGNFYDSFIEKFEGDITRDEVKKLMFEILFSRNEVYYGHKRFIPFEKEKQIFQSVYPSVYEMIEALKTKDNALLAILLQQMEARIFIDTIARELVNYGIIPLTVHDSIIVPAQSRATALLIMQRTFQKQFGVIPMFEKTELKQKNDIK